VGILETGYENIKWIKVAKATVEWHAAVMTMMQIWVP
jgi:hypothetical protein